MSNAFDKLKQKAKEAKEKEASSTTNNKTTPAEYWGNVGVTIPNEDGEEIFISLFGYALDDLKCVNGTTQSTTVRNSFITQILKTMGGLEKGENEILTHKGKPLKFDLQIKRVGEPAVMSEELVSDILDMYV